MSHDGRKEAKGFLFFNQIHSSFLCMKTGCDIFARDIVTAVQGITTTKLLQTKP